jgi:hypothetical protein
VVWQQVVDDRDVSKGLLLVVDLCEYDLEDGLKVSHASAEESATPMVVAALLERANPARRTARTRTFSALSVGAGSSWVTGRAPGAQGAAEAGCLPPAGARARGPGAAGGTPANDSACESEQLDTCHRNGVKFAPGGPLPVAAGPGPSRFEGGPDGPLDRACAWVAVGAAERVHF